MKKYILIILAVLSFTAVSVTPAHAESAMLLIENEQQPKVTILDGNSIHVTGAAGMTLYIYDIAGVVKQTIKVDGPDRNYFLNLPKGCYIIKVGKTVRKVSIS